MKNLFILVFAFASFSALADRIVCKQGDRPISVVLESKSDKSSWRMEVVDHGEVIYNGNAKLTKKPSYNDGSTVFSSTTKAEGSFTNGALPSWILTLEGNGRGNLEILSYKLQDKLTMFETNETLYCR